MKRDHVSTCCIYWWISLIQVCYIFFIYTIGVATEDTDESQNDVFEEKLSDAIDGLSQKSAQGRTSNFEAVCNIFCKKYIPDYILNRCELYLSAYC